MDIAVTLENSPKLACEDCDYSCSKPSDLLKHFNTIKHKRITKGYNDIAVSPKKISCKCGKKYNFTSGLWRHKKNCNETEEIHYGEKPDLKMYEDTNILLKLLNQNQEFQKLIVEQNKQIMELSSKNCSITNTSSNNNNSNNNSNNSFNLNLFLNETCKDAMNIKDFIDSLQVQFKDLEYNGENGYAAGISNIFLRELNKLDICKRPIHCSDVKREVFHIKNEDGWEKERELLIKCIKQITRKNIVLLADWRNAHPGCMDLHNKINDKYNKINCETLGPYLDDEELKCFNKIINKVAKATVINKQHSS
jgi:hypothetical protein